VKHQLKRYVWIAFLASTILFLIQLKGQVFLANQKWPLVVFYSQVLVENVKQ